ncbi:hypothetical protein KAJ41_02790 [Candidatus Parcubacteria bacterium]|nr:hypothetical protein [Candidatus Parcubacteria bacterium]
MAMSLLNFMVAYVEKLADFSVDVIKYDINEVLNITHKQLSNLNLL